MGNVGAYGVSESNATDSSDQIRWEDANGYKYIRDAIGISDIREECADLRMDD
jgi:hypothetical protein